MGWLLGVLLGGAVLYGVSFYIVEKKIMKFDEELSGFNAETDGP